MTVQPEIVNELVDKIAADCECRGGRVLFRRDGKRTTVTPASADAAVRIRRAWFKAEKLGVGPLVLAGLRARGRDLDAAPVSEAAE